MFPAWFFQCPDKVDELWGPQTTAATKIAADGAELRYSLDGIRFAVYSLRSKVSWTDWAKRREIMQVNALVYTDIMYN